MSAPELTAQEKAERAVKQGRMFISQTRTKMEQLVEDFADGKLNREQFQMLYDRYQTQINGVKLILMENDPSMWSTALDTQETLALRKKLLAKAVGLVVYLNKTGTLLDTLGKFEVDGTNVAKLMQKFKEYVDKHGEPTSSHPTEIRYRQMVVELPPYDWMFIAKGLLTTTITRFSREPTQDQRETMIRLLRDFEMANTSHLKKPNVTVEDLAMPFQVFVKRQSR